MIQFFTSRSRAVTAHHHTHRNVCWQRPDANYNTISQTWEAAMFAASHNLNNLCLIIDLNSLQVEGNTDEVLKMEPIDKKFEAFGWNAIISSTHWLVT